MHNHSLDYQLFKETSNTFLLWKIVCCILAGSSVKVTDNYV